MKMKLLMRLFCALLSVLMLMGVLPTLTVFAAEGDGSVDVSQLSIDKYVEIQYTSIEQRLENMQLYYTNGEFQLYCDARTGDVAYRNIATGEIMLTNPWDIASYTNLDKDTVLAPMRSQILVSYEDNTGKERTMNSYTDAILKGQIAVKSVKGGVRVEYAIGNIVARSILPSQIERTAFEEKILAPLAENAGKSSQAYRRVKAYYNEILYATLMDNGETEKAEGYAAAYPITKQKGVDIYVLQQDITKRQKAELEGYITTYCPDYSYEELDNDHAFLEYEGDAASAEVFRMALEYTLDANKGVVVTLPANGIRYDQTAFRLRELNILPYMGASKNTNDGYSFLPDASGALVALKDRITLFDKRVYGDDYAMNLQLDGGHSQVIRMPVFGQVETITTEATATQPATSTQRGYLAIIESGEAMGSIEAIHEMSQPYSYVHANFIVNPYDKVEGTSSTWTAYSARRYVEDYQLRYIMLNDSAKADAANLKDRYECTWLGMAFAYRDYLAQTDGGYQRLTDEEVGEAIPLYIETFGAIDSVEKIMSMPVTVSVPLTSFENVATMYDYLAGEGVTNVNFKLTGYANGGMYSDVPYKLKWEKSVGGASGFEDLVAYAAEKGFEVFPDFDFVYTTQADGGSKVNMKKNAARTIENRYTARRLYSATKQGLVSYYQMVLAPETYSKFYEKLAKKYASYEGATGISLATFGNSLNSDFDEDKSVMREEAKEYVKDALAYFKNDYNVMLDGGNAYTWGYADHILNVPLDSSRYTYELSTVPFMGVVLHGYVEFAGSPVNMEGNLTYAMLKAMENGAAAYFVLSYANTELLKEDVLLSQHYSVRYDIWQSRLVEIYKELNAVLFDVQTKLIIGHRFLEGVRTPDEDELLADIEKAALEKAAAIEKLIQDKHNEEVTALRTARETAVGAAGKINALTNYVTLMDQERASVTGTQTKYLINAWNTYLSSVVPADMTVNNLNQYFKDSIVFRYVNMKKNLDIAAEHVIAAKKSYEYLLANSDEVLLHETAAEGLAQAVVAYENILSAYHGQTATVSSLDSVDSVETLRAAVTLTGTVVTAPTDLAGLEAYILGTTASDAYNGIGMEELYNAFVNLMVLQNLYNPADPESSVVNIKAMEESFETPVAPAEPDNGSTGNQQTKEEPVTNDKYAIDGDIVMVTYGEVGTPYKSLILNFNNYAVETKLDNGVTYTIEAYGYVVIYH